MWMWLSLLGLIAQDFDRLDLESLGFYGSVVINLAQIGEKTLVSSHLENRICLLDNQGHLLAKFDQAGPGPRELNKPLFLGATPQRLFFLTDNHMVLVFDHDLKLTDERLPYPGRRPWKGKFLSRDERLLILSTRGGDYSHALTVLRLDSGKWQAEKQLIPVKWNQETWRPEFETTYDDGLAFNFNHPEGDHYEVAVYRILPELEATPMATLAAPVEEMVTPGGRVLLTGASQLGRGFVIHPVLVDARKFQRLAGWFDYFDEAGHFIRREACPAEIGMVVTAESPVVWKFDSDRMILEKLPTPIELLE